MRNPGYLAFCLAAALTVAVGQLSASDGSAQLQEQPRTSSEYKRPTQAFVTRQQPENLALATNLSARDRRENFEALWSIIDANYAHFKLKGIDWNAIGHKYQARVEAVTSDDDFYRLMFQLVNELKDTHSWIQNFRYKDPRLAAYPNVPVDAFGNKVFIVGGSRAGWEVLSVDGKTVAEKIESLRPNLGGLSSERAFQRTAARAVLAGPGDESVSVELRSPQGVVETVTWRRFDRQPWPPAPRVSIVLTRQKTVHFGRYPSGIGYIRIESFNGRQEITQEFDRALEALRDAPALILDIRDNRGGFNHSDIVGRFLRKHTNVGYSYIKDGPKHGDFRKIKETDEPKGKWQYTNPVALLVNDVTGSAADLFAMEIRNAPQVITLGTTTHGNLSGVAVYGVLPCGIVVRISNGYISDAKDRPIEVYGNAPDFVVEPTVQDVLEGRDPVIEKATEVLLKRMGK